MGETLRGKKKQCIAKTSIIPHDVIVDKILPRLPTKSLIRCRCVCKLWSTSIALDDQHFFHYSLKNQRLLFKFVSMEVSQSYFLGRHDKNHFYYQGEEEDGIVNLLKVETIKSAYNRKLVGSCNGLICLYNVDAQLFEVCNPTRHEILAIFSLHNIIDHRSFKCYGFGFDTLSMEYKVIFVFDTTTCMVFTLGGIGSSWREITISPEHVRLRWSTFYFRDFGIPFESKSSFYCNGALYWMGQGPQELVSFNIHTEKFQVIQVPTSESFDMYPNQPLVFKGSLCILRLKRLSPSAGKGQNRSKHGCTVHLHKMLKDDNYIHEQVVRWTEETIVLGDLAFELPENTEAVVFSNDKLILHWLDRGRLGLYNVHERRRIKVRSPNGLPNMNFLDYYLTCHVENFLSLRTFTHGEDQGATNTEILDCYPPLNSIQMKERPTRAGIAFLFISPGKEEPRIEFYL